MNFHLIFVDDWEANDESGGVYPEGARDKKRLRSPEADHQYIKPNWYYLFKESDRRYPDQFLVEILAYHLGRMLKISVPPAYPAYSKKENKFAALIEWFYSDDDIKHNKCEFNSGSSYFVKKFAEFDIKKGSQHNIEDFIKITKPIFQEKYWYQEFSAMIFLDMFIGNTDRHQDNWGVLVNNTNGTSRFAPWFDNGTSLGCERHLKDTANWTDEQIRKYINNGKFHFRVSQECLQTRVPHFEVINILKSKEGLVDVEKILNEMVVYLSRVDFLLIEDVLRQFQSLSLPAAHKITHERLTWMAKLLKFRFDKMKEVLK